MADSHLLSTKITQSKSLDEFRPEYRKEKKPKQEIPMTKCMIILSVFFILSGLLWAGDSELRILTENYPPLSFIENGVITGYGADVVAAIQKQLGTEFPVELQVWDKAYDVALNEANVLLFTMEKTVEREKLFQFVGPLGSNTAWFYIPFGSKLEIKDLDAARKLKSIATTTDWFTEQQLVKMDFKNLKSVADPIETIHLVLKGEAEAAVYTDLTFPQLAKEAGVAPKEFKPVLELMRSEYYLAFSAKTDPQIVKLWSEAFNKLQESGELKAIKGRWDIP